MFFSFFFFPLVVVIRCFVNDHVFVQGKYFVVKDTLEKDDILQTLQKNHAPNFWRTKADFPVFSCGQPTANGVVALLDSFLDRFRVTVTDTRTRVHVLVVFIYCGIR